MFSGHGADGLLFDDEPDDVTVDGGERGDCCLMREARVDEDAQGLFHRLVERGVGQAGSADHPGAVAMKEQDLA